MHKIESFVAKDTVVTAITIPTPFAVGDVNMYLLERAGFVVLVDAGIDADDAWQALVQALDARALTVQSLDAVFLTHHHEDHVGLVPRIVETKQVPVYVHERSIVRLVRDPDYMEGRIRFFDDLYRRMGCGEYGARRIASMRKRLHSPDKVRMEQVSLCAVDEGARIPELPGVEIYYLPGHAVDHLVLFDPDSHWLFSGDVLLPHISSNAFVEPDERNWQRVQSLCLYRTSLERCALLPAERVFPGHGHPFTDHRSLVAHRLQRMDAKAGRLYAMLEESPARPMSLCTRMYPTQMETQFALVASEVMGLLDYLREDGRIAMDTDELGYICRAL